MRYKTDFITSLFFVLEAKQTADKLKRELFYNGNTETDKVKQLRSEFKTDSERLSKFLDREV